MRYKLPNFYNSATNKQLLNINTLQNRELKKVEVAKLTSSGYICIVPSIKKDLFLIPQEIFTLKTNFIQNLIISGV